jgi:hypothetical protein
MPIIRFNIGEAFPADEPVARFVTVLAMASNDCQRSMAALLSLPDAPDSGAVGLMYFRQQAAMVFEVALFIRDAVQEHPEVQVFLDTLPRTAKDRRDQIVGSIEKDSPHFLGTWLGRRRNTTFHYPKMDRRKATQGNEEIQTPMAEAASVEGTINLGGTLAETRFWFADEVVVQWFQEDHTALREPLLAIPLFAEEAFASYRSTRPSVFTDEGTGDL